MMLPLITQRDRLFYLETPLGEDVLITRSFTGTEAMSTLFHFHLVVGSESHDIDFNDIVGFPVTLSVRQNDGVSRRYFNGYVSRFVQQPEPGRMAIYHADVVPWLWFLTLTADCLIYQQKTLPQIIAATFARYGFSDYRMDLVMPHSSWEYCTQYRESAFAFVSRLMEIEGMYYYFEHEDGKHTMVITDHRSTMKPCPYQSTFAYEKVIGAGYRHTDDSIYEWVPQKSVQTAKYSHKDYNFLTPDDPLYADMDTLASEQTDGWDKSDEGWKYKEYELYDYPGKYQTNDVAQDWARLRIEEQESGHDTAHGKSNCRSMLPGYKFNLVNHFRADQNRAYMLTHVEHSGEEGTLFGGTDEGEAHYENHFGCMPADVQYRAPRNTKKHRMLGSQTAFVVGPPGEEIHTDEYGRVRVKFHWDRAPGRPADSSCWIRVMHQWTGAQWGHQWIPRVGQEVIVDFLEGDPDRPIITGCVYNQDNRVPYSLPGNKTVSGFKTHSTVGGGADNYNEIRLEDKIGQELFSMQAERDMFRLVKRDETDHIQRDRHMAIDRDETIQIGHDQSLQVGNDRNKLIAHDQKLSVGHDQTEMIAGDQKRTVGKSESEQVGEDYSMSVGKSHTVQVGMEADITVGEKYSGMVGLSREWTIGLDDSVKVGGEISMQAGLEMHLKAGLEVAIEAGQKLVLKGPGGHIEINNLGVIIEGKKIFLNCGGAATPAKSASPGAPSTPQSFNGDPFADGAPDTSINNPLEGLSAGPMGSLDDMPEGLSAGPMGSLDDMPEGLSAGPMGSLDDMPEGLSAGPAGSLSDFDDTSGMLQGGVSDTVLDGGVSDTVLDGGVSDTVLQGGVSDTVLQGGVSQTDLIGGVTDNDYPSGGPGVQEIVSGIVLPGTPGGGGPGGGTPGGDPSGTPGGGTPGTGSPGSGSGYLQGYVLKEGEPEEGEKPESEDEVTLKTGVEQEMPDRNTGEKEPPKLGIELGYQHQGAVLQKPLGGGFNLQAGAYQYGVSTGVTKEPGGGYSNSLIKAKVGGSLLKLKGEQDFGAVKTKESLDYGHVEGSAFVGTVDTPEAHLAKAEFGGEIDAAKISGSAETGIPLPIVNQVLTVETEGEAAVGLGWKASYEEGWSKEEGYHLGWRVKALAGLGWGTGVKLGLKPMGGKP
jgi:type VI secretion system secreted protein VgrG